MIGNIIQTLYLTNFQYPQAAALSFMLMAALLIGICRLRAGPGHAKHPGVRVTPGPSTWAAPRRRPPCEDAHGGPHAARSAAVDVG